IVLNATADKLRPLGRAIKPIGQGTASAGEWERFVRHAYSLQMESVSVWRYGTASGDVWPTLNALAPTLPEPLVVAPEVEAPPAAESMHSPPATDNTEAQAAEASSEPVVVHENVPVEIQASEPQAAADQSNALPSPPTGPEPQA